MKIEITLLFDGCDADKEDGIYFDSRKEAIKTLSFKHHVVVYFTELEHNRFYSPQYPDVSTALENKYKRFQQRMRLKDAPS